MASPRCVMTLGHGSGVTAAAAGWFSGGGDCAPRPNGRTGDEQHDRVFATARTRSDIWAALHLDR